MAFYGFLGKPRATSERGNQRPPVTMIALAFILLTITGNSGNPFSLDDNPRDAIYYEEHQRQNSRSTSPEIDRIDSAALNNDDFAVESNDQLTAVKGNSTNDLGPYIEHPKHYYLASFREILKGEESTELVFDQPPDGELYEMPNPGETAEIFVFAYLGQFLSFIQPYDIPVEFLRDVLWNRLSIVSLIFQSLRFESGFVACVTIGVLLSLVVPAFAVASSCSNLCVPSKRVSDSASLNGMDVSVKSLVFAFFLIILMIGSGITAMLVTNEQLSVSVLTAPGVLSSALNDISAYIRNTQRQMHHVTVGAWTRVSERVYHDLDAIEEQLGVPIKKQIAAETGVDVALDALFDIATVTDNLSKKVAELSEAHSKLRQLSQVAADRLADLRHQVDSLRRACNAKDRPLCVTIDSAGLDITIRTDALNVDPRLTMLQSMIDQNLPVSVERVREKFSQLPARIGGATKTIRTDIKQELELRKSRLERSMNPFDTFTKDLRLRINKARELTPSIGENVKQIEQWRWMSFLVTTILVLLIWLVFVLALIYSCCDQEPKSKSLLITGLVFSSLLSILLWTIALAVMLVGGHGEVFICRPLYDQPDYKSLSALIDDPGVIYQRGGGFFQNLLTRNQTLDVPLKSMLGACKENRTAYAAFRLNSVIAIEHHSELLAEIFQSFHRFHHNLTELNFMELELQNKLQSLLQATSVNMTAHRFQISRPVTGKDLTSFAKQLDSVANQIKDLATSSRVESIASRTRRIISTNIEPLEKQKEEMVYQITAIEVQILPLQRQVNQSISHLKTIQFYIDNQSENIFKNKSEEYSKKLMNYLSRYQGQLTDGLLNTVAKCSPVFNIFNAIRHHVCQKTMDPLNGFWFALVWSMLGILFATPITLNLIYHYGRPKESILNNGSVCSAERATIWNTPGHQANNDDNW